MCVCKVMRLWCVERVCVSDRRWCNAKMWGRARECMRAKGVYDSKSVYARVCMYMCVSPPVRPKMSAVASRLPASHLLNASVSCAMITASSSSDCSIRSFTGALKSRNTEAMGFSATFSKTKDCSACEGVGEGVGERRFRCGLMRLGLGVKTIDFSTTSF